jgi:hypothetical protein
MSIIVLLAELPQAPASSRATCIDIWVTCDYKEKDEKVGDPQAIIRG